MLDPRGDRHARPAGASRPAPTLLVVPDRCDLGLATSPGGRRVGLSSAAAPVAVGIALAYYSLYLLGKVLTRMDGRIIRPRSVA
jgi:hypothetical protein